MHAHTLIATFGGKARVAQVLIEGGANVNKCDKNGKTPLMVRTLHIDLRLLNKIVFMYAQLASLNGFKDLVQLLLANGADPVAKTKVRL